MCMCQCIYIYTCMYIYICIIIYYPATHWDASAPQPPFSGNSSGFLGPEQLPQHEIIDPKLMALRGTSNLS